MKRTGLLCYNYFNIDKKDKGGLAVKRRVLSILLALALLTGSGGCATRVRPSSPGHAPEESRRLVVYTSHKEEVWWPIVKEFEERTGIWVDVVYGATSELLERLSQEEKAPRADVMFGGGAESLETYRDCFTPYACAGSDHVLARFRAPDDLWTPFSALPVVLVYNTKLVEPGQIVRWSDLLSPALKGRIAFTDPAVSGSSFTGLLTMLYALDGDWNDTIRRFAGNLEGTQLDDSGEVLTAVARGDSLVGITLEESALKRMAEGLNVAMVYPEDGSSCVPDGSALVRGAPHPDNAKLFLDFTVSFEVQHLLVSQFCRRSVRDDVEPLADLPALDQIPLTDYDIDRAAAERESILMTWAFYFGEDKS